MRAQISMWFAASLQYLAIVTRKTLSASAARLASGCAPFVALVLASLPHLSGTSKLDERVCA